MMRFYPGGCCGGCPEKICSTLPTTGLQVALANLVDTVTCGSCSQLEGSYNCSTYFAYCPPPAACGVSGWKCAICYEGSLQSYSDDYCDLGYKALSGVVWDGTYWYLYGGLTWTGYTPEYDLIFYKRYNSKPDCSSWSNEDLGSWKKCPVSPYEAPCHYDGSTTIKITSY